MAHTPGPWHVDSVGNIRTARGDVIADASDRVTRDYMDRAERAANARLIASAPALLAALENALVAMTTTRIASGGVSPFMADAITAARAALAAAREIA